MIYVTDKFIYKIRYSCCFIK